MEGGRGERGPGGAGTWQILWLIDSSSHKNLVCTFPDKTESVHPIGKVSKQSRNFPDGLESFQAILKLGVWKLSQMSFAFSVCLEIIRIAIRHSGKARNVDKNWHVPRQTWKFPDNFGNLQTVQKSSKNSGKFPDDPRIESLKYFHFVWK